MERNSSGGREERGRQKMRRFWRQWWCCGGGLSTNVSFRPVETEAADSQTALFNRTGGSRVVSLS